MKKHDEQPLDTLTRLLNQTSLTRADVAWRVGVTVDDLNDMSTRYCRGAVRANHLRRVAQILTYHGADQGQVEAWLYDRGVVSQVVSRQVAASDVSQLERTLRNAVAGVPVERHAELLALLREAVQ